MQNTPKTAGQTAPRTLVIFRDCHSRNNIVVTANSDREEEKIRLRALSDGFLVAVRKPKNLGQILDTTWTPATTKSVWRKPAAIAERLRPKTFGTFRLTLTASAIEGGAV